MTLRVYTTLPQSKDHAPERYRRLVREVARISAAAGCHGILIYTDNGLVDPWQLAPLVAEAGPGLKPLVAVQPAYMHPYWVAKEIATLAYLHGASVELNLLAGGFKRDLEALGDRTEHDRRYERLVEYATIVRRLVRGESVSFSGRWYELRALQLAPPVPPEFVPAFLVSGSSPAGRAAARALDALAVEYPPAPGEPGAASDGLRTGIRLGLIARSSREEAWAVARSRFPEDREGRLRHKLATKVSDSSWHRVLAAAADEGTGPGACYWLHPFRTYRTFCPYLVGDFELVAARLAAYLERGHEALILDIPPDAEDLACSLEAVRRAEARVASGEDRG